MKCLVLLMILASTKCSAEFIGCLDVEDFVHHILIDYLVVIPNLTYENCRAHCAAATQTFYAVWKGDLCVCGRDDLFTALIPLSTTFDCFDENAVRCSGNPVEYCGSETAVKVFSVCPGTTTGINCQSSCSATCDGLGGRCEVDDASACLEPHKFPNACSDGTFGPGCRFQCSDGCTDEKCDFKTGKCAKSCETGKGNYCLASCLPGQWGDDCQNECDTFCQTANCDHDTGRCDECLDRWGTFCEEACPDGCANGATCNRTTGKCDDGCNYGLWGETCTYDCNDHCDPRTCDQADGHCLESCSTGYYGNHCTATCPTGCLSQQCRKHDGMCSITGCEPGWWGETCDQTCPEHCMNAECHADNGRCSSCEDGWHGEECQQRTYGNDAIATGCYTTVLVIGAALAGAVVLLLIESITIAVLLFRKKQQSGTDPVYENTCMT